MSFGKHFSLDTLPERYRVQAARQLAGEKGKENVHPVAPKAEKGRSRSSKRISAPIRMSRKDGGPNKTEEKFNRDVLHGLGKYEALTLNLPGGTKYTPDWMLEDGGEVFLFETKGSYHLPTHGRSVMAFKVACAEFPMFTFVFAELGKDGKTWTIGRYKGGKDFGTVVGTAKQLDEME